VVLMRHHARPSNFRALAFERKQAPVWTRAARSIRAATGEGEDRTGELLEPSLMPR
jgi:hypothetical protein